MVHGLGCVLLLEHRGGLADDALLARRRRFHLADVGRRVLWMSHGVRSWLAAAAQLGLGGVVFPVRLALRSAHAVRLLACSTRRSCSRRSSTIAAMQAL